MRTSRYVILLYAALLGVPLLLYLRIVSLANGLELVSTILLGVAALGLIVFGIMGFAEVYLHKRTATQNISLPLTVESPMRSGSTSGRNDTKMVTFKVRRFDDKSQSLKEHNYKMEADSLTTVLGALINIKERHDPALSMRYSCRMGICGSCGMVVNGKPSLACETNVFDKMNNDEIVVEPMYGHPLLKDLVTDFDDFFEKHISVNPGIYRKNVDEKYGAKKPFEQTREQIDKFLPYSYCIMCGLCNDACPVVNSNPEFVGPQALSQVYRYHADSRDQKGKKRLFDADTVNGVWGCEFAGACSKVCPKGVDPAASIQLLKGELFKEIATNDEKG